MSRAPAKGNKDKTKPPAAQTPVIAHEIVPGKFNENDWNAMLDRDSSEEFVQEIMDEIVLYTMDEIYKKYIDRQLLPFTIAQAKDAILQIIEWEFLARDEGESNLSDLGWIQDKEPEALTTDCWAQGSVPKIHIFGIPTPLVEEPEEKEIFVAKEEVIIEEEKVEEDNEPEGPELPELEDKVSITDTTQEEFSCVKVSKSDSEEKVKKFRPYRGVLKREESKIIEPLARTEMKLREAEVQASQSSTVLSNIFTMPTSCHSLLKVQAGRPPGEKDVTYDAMGNVIAVMKLNPEKLPSHRVSLKYKMIDPKVEAAQAHLDAMRKGHRATQLDRKSKKITIADMPAFTGKIQAKTERSNSQLPPSLFEVIEISPGVQVTENGHSKKGQERQVRKADLLEHHQKDLQPISLLIRRSSVSVSDLLHRTTPILREFNSPPPLPPITSLPPNKSQVS